PPFKRIRRIGKLQLRPLRKSLLDKPACFWCFLPAMRVPVRLSEAFSQEHGSEFERWIASFAVGQDLLESDTGIGSKRFLGRSIAPHVEKLSDLFNRINGRIDGGAPGGRNYWRDSSNPRNLRLAYLLAFMPCNLFRMASVWAELSRLGFRWPKG